MGDGKSDSDPAGVEVRGRPLDGLARRLGALEESLTVVASEMGVAAMPSFKRLDPDQVYREAGRRAESAVEPLRIAVRRLESRLDEIVLVQSQLRREIAAAAEAAKAARAQAGEARASIDALPDTGQPLDELRERIDALVARFDSRDHAPAAAVAPEPPPPDPAIARLVQRLAVLESAIAARATDQEIPTSGNDIAVLLASVDARIEQRLSGRTSSSEEPAAIEREVARQIDALLKNASGGSAAVSPLVMGAAERAIVRLTRRIEKLEERTEARGGSDGSRARSGLMGRLFES